MEKERIICQVFLELEVNKSAGWDNHTLEEFVKEQFSNKHHLNMKANSVSLDILHRGK
jgi:hypothetical protein